MIGKPIIIYNGNLKAVIVEDLEKVGYLLRGVISFVNGHISSVYINVGV